MTSRARRAIVLGGAVAATAVAGATLTSTTANAAKFAPKRITMVSSEAAAQSVAQYWTPANLKAAKSYTDVVYMKGKFKPGSGKVSKDGGAGSVAPGAPGGSSGGYARNVNLPYTVGKVFFRVNGQRYWCSASSIQSKYRNLVATAGHCVYDTETNRLADRWVFVPAYKDGKAAFGIYVGHTLNLHPDFEVFEDYDRDFAFVNVHSSFVWDRNGKLQRDEKGKPVRVRLGDQVGGQGFAWNQDPKSTVWAFGYPAGKHLDGDQPYSGHTMKSCYGSGKAMPVAAKFNAQEHVGIKCAFTPGASGGPWIKNYNQSKRAGYIVGVNSLAWDTDANGRYDHISSPYFDGQTAAVYNYAANLWTK
ncbi:trypsin-like serine peptidase [Bailinhaonella thermotolerans]|uniref:Serine protease n=1 Tax=Bailinhaonella thermotolerans TaxID=1070861 RepID=A0A3A4AIZ8_9ACTN|nr:trypsin-like serine protease [Bailinhaonella thermotolerans]RJL26587.1 serine protease [Bailinhaonella thermotolerans]